MRIGVISDTHNQHARTRLAVAVLREAGAVSLVHCGDLTGPGIVEACAGLPLTFVLGNNDHDMVPALERAALDAGAVFLGWSGEIELAGKRIAVAHGHLTSDVRRLLASGPDYLLTGHSHEPHDTMAGPTRRINPGALHRATRYTVAVLDLERDEVELLHLS